MPFEMKSIEDKIDKMLNGQTPITTVKEFCIEYDISYHLISQYSKKLNM